MYIYIYIIYIRSYIYIYIYKIIRVQKARKQNARKQNGRNIYAIIKIMCPPGYHRNGCVATHALEHIMYIMYPGA